MKTQLLLLLYLSLALLAVQCERPAAGAAETESPASPPPMPERAGQPADLLDVVRERGFLKVGVRVWPDANFQPPLFRSPLAGLDGYEVDLAWALAEGLGVGLEMAESDPRRLAGGGWAGEWDIALAWLPATDNARQRLYFSLPYAYDAGQLAVHSANETISTLADLRGRKIGAPAFTLYQQVLAGQRLTLAGQPIAGSIPPAVTVAAYNRDGNAIRDLAEGDGVILDAVLHSRLVLASAVRAGWPVKVVAEPIPWLPVGVAFDRLGMPSERLRAAIDDILAGLRSDGTLADLSFKWYDEDISQPP